MDKKPFDTLFYLLRLLGDIILFALLRAMYKNSMSEHHKLRKTTLILLLVYVVIYIVGIFRNMHTLGTHYDAASFNWLTFDIFETINAMWWWYVVYKCILLTHIERNIMIANALIMTIGNIISFKLNFYYLPYEGLKVFIFWFINNGSGILSCVAVAYMLYYKLVMVKHKTVLK